MHSTLLRLTANGALVYHSTPEQRESDPGKHPVYTFHADFLKQVRDRSAPDVFDDLMADTLDGLTAKADPARCDICNSARVLNVRVTGAADGNKPLPTARLPIFSIQFLCDPCHVPDALQGVRR